jgi:hypothetical protein
MISLSQVLCLKIHGTRATIVLEDHRSSSRLDVHDIAVLVSTLSTSKIQVDGWNGGIASAKKYFSKDILFDALLGYRTEFPDEILNRIFSP